MTLPRGLPGALGDVMWSGQELTSGSTWPHQETCLNWKHRGGQLSPGHLRRTPWGLGRTGRAAPEEGATTGPDPPPALQARPRVTCQASPHIWENRQGCGEPSTRHSGPSAAPPVPACWLRPPSQHRTPQAQAGSAPMPHTWTMTCAPGSHRPLPASPIGSLFKPPSRTLVPTGLCHST